MAGLPPPSDEQRKVVQAVANGWNVRVDSVAGSGKTTCILHAAQAPGIKSTLVLTYNKRLQSETETRVKRLEAAGVLPRGAVDVVTHHAFAGRWFLRQSGRIDNAKVSKYLTEVKRHLEMQQHGPPSMHPLPEAARAKRGVAYDLVVVDEAQDLSPLLYEMVCLFFANVAAQKVSPPRLVVLGDHMQNIFQSLGADERFIVLTQQLFSYDLPPPGCPWPERSAARVPSQRFCDRWVHLELRTSFRITRGMAEFVSRDLLKKTGYIRHNARDPAKHSQHDSEGRKSVTYFVTQNVHANSFGDVHSVMYELQKVLFCKYQPEEIFILSFSLKSEKCPLRRLENELKAFYGKHLAIEAHLGDTPMNAAAAAGKLSMTTIHSTKGLERKCVFVYGFDSYWEANYNEDLPPERKGTCPNVLYVAATRATEQLVVIHNEANFFLKFVNSESIQRGLHCRYVATGDPIGRARGENEEGSYMIQEVPVTELLAHLTEADIERAMTYITVKEVAPPGPAIPVSTTIPIWGGSGMVEQVADLTGIAVPAAYQYRQQGRMAIREKIEEQLEIYDELEKTKKNKALDEGPSKSLLKALRGYMLPPYRPRSSQPMSQPMSQPVRKRKFGDVDSTPSGPVDLVDLTLSGTPEPQDAAPATQAEEDDQVQRALEFSIEDAAGGMEAPFDVDDDAEAAEFLAELGFAKAPLCAQAETAGVEAEAPLEIPPADLLRTTVKFSVMGTGFMSRLDQIDHFDWLSMAQLRECYQRLDTLGIANGAYEVGIELHERFMKLHCHELHQRRAGKPTSIRALVGHADCWDYAPGAKHTTTCLNGDIVQKPPKRVLEFKCVTGPLTDIERLQLALYMYLTEMKRVCDDAMESMGESAPPRQDGLRPIKLRRPATKMDDDVWAWEDEESCRYIPKPDFDQPPRARYEIFNVLTGEREEVTCGSLQDLKDMVGEIVRAKYGARPVKEDHAFLEEMKERRRKYPGLEPGAPS